MFKDEVLRKFNAEELCDYEIIFFGKCKVAFSGIKGVTFLSETEIRLKTKKNVLTLKGNGLSLVEVGGFEAYVTGEVVSFEII